MSSGGPVTSTARFEKSYNVGQLDSLQVLRHIVQLITFVFLNAKVLGIVATAVIVPYLHVSQAPFSVVTGAYDSLEYTITHCTFPLITLGVIYLAALTVGKAFCGWACPFGMVQDFLSYLPFQKRRSLSASALSQLKDVKWVVVGFSLFCSLLVCWRRAATGYSLANVGRVGFEVEDPIGVFSDAPFAVINPSGTLFAYIPWMAIWKTGAVANAGFAGYAKILLFVGVIVPSLYIPRFFCRFMCPMAAIMEPVFRYRFLKINWNQSKVSREEANNILLDVCPMGVTIDKESTSGAIDNVNCIHCGKCVTEQPSVFSQRLLERDN
eukprot:TRINITY_DN16492_c0_g1_i1.p1 TRINITY_DN16492_c0_g1~~TRINITY_DN16492_c0_g1_i1.p1  ORF type:complete len:324 (-),score=41.86 TRINITY_DN16492_c0_g1_i1:51-1022(-)